MQINRELLLKKFRDFAASGNGLVVGQPGVGKTFLLKKYAEDLIEKNFPCLYIPIDRLGVENENEFKSALGFKNDFISFLKSNKANTSERGIVVFDSYDAARSEKAQTFFLDVIRDVITELGDSWNVIVSVRIYDAKKSEELLELFPMDTTDNNEYRHLDINSRHFFIPILSHDEVKDVALTVNGLTDVYQNGSNELKEILRVPFNLWLMEKLLIANSNTDELTTIYSEIQLLGMFWNKRVVSGGKAMDKEKILHRITSKMVFKRSLSVVKNEVYKTGEQILWDSLLSSEVLSNISTASQRVSFSHNILFDYAVSVLLIDDDPKELEKFITSDPARPLFLRPSLDYYLTRLWYSHTPIFWKVFWYVLPNQNINLRLFARLLPTGVIAKEAKTIEEIDPLLSALSGSKEHASEAFLYLLQAVRTLNVGRNLLWIKILEKASNHIEENFVWDLTIVTNAIFESNKNQSDEIVNISGNISRNLFRWAWEKRNVAFIERLSSTWITPLVAKTFGTDPIKSKELLSRILTITKEKNFTIQYLLRLADEVDKIWSYDPIFVKEIYLTIFGHHESSEEKTSFGTPVLPMSSTRRQDYGMCQYQLIENFPKFINDVPLVAIETAILCINQYIIKEHILPYLKKDATINDLTKSFNLFGTKVEYFMDMSYIWDASRHSEEPLKMANELFAYINKLAEESKSEEIKKILIIFRSFGKAAFFWKRLISIATKTPKVFSSLLFELCISESILRYPETSYEIGLFINSAAQHFSKEQLLQIENKILSLTRKEKNQKRKEILEEIRNRLLFQIPKSLLKTEEGINIVKRLSEEAKIPSNKPPVGFTEWTREVEEEKIEISDKSIEDDVVRYLTTLKDFNANNRNGIPNVNEIKQAQPTAKKLLSIINKSNETDEKLRPIWTCLAEFASNMSRAVMTLDTKDLRLAKKILLLSAESKFPEPNPKYDSAYTSASWSPDPRIEAAQGLTWIAIKMPTKDVINTIKILASDPVPSVRFLIVHNLFRISESAPKVFWELMIFIAANEKNRVILEALCFSLSWVISNNENNSEKILREIQRKFIDVEDESNLLDNFIPLIVWLAITRNNKWAIRQLNKYLKNPLEYSKHLKRATFEIVTSFVNPQKQNAKQEGFSKAIEWLMKSIDSVNKEFKIIQPQLQNSNVSEKLQSKIRDLYEVIDEIVTRIYFAADVNDRISNNDKLKLTDKEREQFYFSIKPLLQYLLSYSSNKQTGMLLAPTAHHFMELLNGVLKYDPKGVLDLATQVVVASKPYGYNIDSLAIREIVNLVESILASYRNDVQDGQSLTNLLLLLDVFAEAGWPEALGLVWRLDEIFR